MDLIHLKHFDFADLVKTSDGHYLGMAKGDIGFNAYIGKPQAPHAGPGLTRSLRIWKGLTEDQKDDVVDAARIRGIDLEQEFGIDLEA